MADAYAAYFMVHKKGANVNSKRLLEVVGAAYGVGDCFFDDNSHHGTPNQRLKAAEWGASLATGNAVLKAVDFANLFDQVLDDLVAPDAN